MFMYTVHVHASIDTLAIQVLDCYRVPLIRWALSRQLESPNTAILPPEGRRGYRVDWVGGGGRRGQQVGRRRREEGGREGGMEGGRRRGWGGGKKERKGDAGKENKKERGGLRTILWRLIQSQYRHIMQLCRPTCHHL